MNFISRMSSAQFQHCRSACGLSPEEEAVMDGLRKEKSIVALSFETGMSTATVSRKIKSLKHKTALEF